MRIIFLHPHFTSAGGAGRAVLETGSRLAARGHHVHCVCIRADQRFVDGYAGIEFHETGGPLSSSLWFWLRFSASCKKINDAVNRIVSEANAEPCVLYPQVFPANWWASEVLKQSPGLRCVWYCQEPSAFIHSQRWINALPLLKNWIAIILRPLLLERDLRYCRSFNNVLVNSEYSRVQVQKVYGYVDETVQRVYLGVDNRSVRSNDGAIRQPWITTIAKLTKFKNVDIIIRAIAILVSGGRTDVRLQVVGEGDASESLRELARSLGLAEYVVFHGYVSDSQVTEILQQSKVFCLASVDEPFGLVAIEALSCGTPVVAVNRGGPKEIVASHGCGLLVDVPTPESLAHAFDRILNPNTDFEKLSRAAETRALDFNWDRTTDRLEQIFVQATQSSEAAKPDSV